MGLLRIVLCLVLSVGPVCPVGRGFEEAWAQTSQSLSDDLSSLQRSKSASAVYASNFTATFFAARTQKTRESRGNVQYQAPKKFRWEVLEPEAEVYTSSGDVLWKYSPVLRHATKMASSDAGLEFLQALTDPKALLERYGIEPWGPAKQQSKDPQAKVASDFDTPPTAATKQADKSRLFAKLVPKGQGTPEEFLYLVANRSTGQVDEIRIAFRNGNKNTIRFQKWSEKSVAADVFDFVPPKGTAVDKM
jgi:outer membrane lipoprotein-sorting protein